MADYPTAELVPGDKWRHVFRVRNSNGDPVNYSNYVVEEVALEYPGGSFAPAVDLSDAVNGNFTLTATDDQTQLVPFGKVSSVKLQLDASGGDEEETVFWAHINGVLTLSVTEVTVYTLGAPGFPTNVTVSTSSPSGGSDGELWFQVPSP